MEGARTLGALLADEGVGAALRRVDLGDGDEGRTVTAIEHDSRHVVPGTLFCCLVGDRADGHDFAAAAVDAGAVALLVTRPLPLPVPQLVTDDGRRAMGMLAAAFHGHPSRSLRLVGVTGTNGKTTTTSLLASVLRSSGISTGLIGTLSGTHTTPESTELQARLAAFRDEGCTAVVMEVSSHALALQRVAGCRFELAVFTNLGRDHLDLHGTQERYFAAKASLFTPQLTDRGLSNHDDPYGRLLEDGAAIPMHAFSMSDVANVRVDAASHGYHWHGVDIRVGLGAAFNVSNSLAAATAAELLGLEPTQIASALAVAPPVPGRFEAVDEGQPFNVVVDYAHTPDGLRALIDSARAVTTGRVIVVFGCGGDRDRDKRPEMGEVAATGADHVVVTSDNPRSEDPLEIINAIIRGVPDDYRDRVVSIPDRRDAIAAACAAASAGDVVVIAGKGHESTQTIGRDVLPFDDRVVAREILGGAT